MISILEKVRAPSRITFYKGLGCEMLASSRLLGCQKGGVSELDGTRDEPQPERGKRACSENRQTPVGDRRDERRFATEKVEHLRSANGRNESSDHEHQAHQCHQRRGDFQKLYHFDLLKELFSTTLLSSRLSVSCDSDNTANIAYMGLKVKPNRKSLYFKAFSGFLYCIKRIKKFSSPKIKIWFEPMFFSGFFCGFERCGSAVFPNFRGGISSPPQAAKCVRTNSRILHQKGIRKLERFASLRSAMILYSILGVKKNSRFRILGEEIFLILNPKTI